MSWGEFASLLAGLSPETPLGRIVSIRAEDDKDMLKNFTPEQRRIRNEWRSREAKRLTASQDARTMVRQFQEMCRQAFSQGGDNHGR